MEIFELAFTVTAVLHLIAGYLIFAIAANEEVHEWMIYDGRNPLAGDIFKYLIYRACWLMIGCGIAAFVMPNVAVVLVWAALGAYVLTGVVDLVEDRRWPSFSKPHIIAVVPRIVGAAALTYFYSGIHA